MVSIEIGGVTYSQAPEVTNGSCRGCVAFIEGASLCDEICDSIKGSCLEAGVIWMKKQDIQKTVEMNQFFGKSITEQIEMFPETLAVTQEEEEAWQTQQKAVATGVTDGTAGRDDRLDADRDDRLDAIAYIEAIGTDPLSVQVGGGHYKSMAIQPVEYITKNNLPYCEANVIKYISRWREKGGKKDLEKAKHYIDMLIQLENL